MHPCYFAANGMKNRRQVTAVPGKRCARFAKRFTFDPANQIGMTGRPIRGDQRDQKRPVQCSQRLRHGNGVLTQIIHPCQFRNQRRARMIAGAMQAQSRRIAIPKPNLENRVFTIFQKFRHLFRQTPEGKSGRDALCQMVETLFHRVTIRPEHHPAWKA